MCLSGMWACLTSVLVLYLAKASLQNHARMLQAACQSSQ